MTRRLTHSQINTWLDGKARSMRRNPTTADGRRCLYEDEKGCHCIVGQLLADHGFAMPAWNHTVAEVRWGAKWSRLPALSCSARPYLHELQQRADRKMKGSRLRPAWRTVIAEHRERHGRLAER